MTGECEFCSSSEVLVENSLAYARPDSRAMSPGHVLIIPKRHEADFFKLDSAEQAAMLALLTEVERLVRSQHAPDGYNVGLNVGKAAGQSRMHVHLNLIPRYAGDVADPSGGVRCVLAGATRQRR